MNTIKKEVKTIYEINKSRFITNIKPVKSVNEAKSFFLNIKKELLFLISAILFLYN